MEETQTPIYVIILAAGKGTRMKSHQSKVLHAVAGIPIISRVIQATLAVNPQKIIVVLGHQADDVKLACSQTASVTFAYQADQLGTGHAVMQAMPLIPPGAGTTLILPGDCPLILGETIVNLMNDHRANDRTCTVLTTHMDNPAAYGRIIRNDENHVCAIREARDCQPDERLITEINSGIYCVDSEALANALTNLSTGNSQGEYYLTDMIEIFTRQNKGIGGFSIQDPGEILGVNSRDDLAEVHAKLHDRLLSHWMKNGVTIISPSTTWIGPEVTIGIDTIVEPGVVLIGKTTIGSECTVGANSVLIDAAVSPHTIIPPLTRLGGHSGTH